MPYIIETETPRGSKVFRFHINKTMSNRKDWLHITKYYKASVSHHHGTRFESYGGALAAMTELSHRYPDLDPYISTRQAETYQPSPEAAYFDAPYL